MRQKNGSNKSLLFLHDSFVYAYVRRPRSERAFLMLMHVILVNYVYDADLEAAGGLLSRYVTLTGWAEGLQAAGARVTVLQRFHQNVRLEQQGIVYQLVADGYGPRLRGWQVPGHLHRRARACCVEGSSPGQSTTIHVNGLLFPLQVRALRATMPGVCAIAVQHHAGRPWPGVRGLWQRWGLGAGDGFLFAARDLAQPFVQQGAIRSSQDVYEVMEGSTRFALQDRAPARARTGLHGTPVVLWVGRLNRNKDPLTVLGGFEGVLEQVPGARLYMVYSEEDLLSQVQSRIAGSATLNRSVELLGYVPYAELAHYYNSADYFVLGSHHESSGYALVEALACGVVPIVTDIASFRMMTDGGRIGALWPPGDAGALSAAALDLWQYPREPLSRAARSFFEGRLSFPAIGRQAVAIYRQLAARRARRMA